MEKSQLMEYLSAVCDAENALYACNEAIAQLQNKLQTIHVPFNHPIEPERQAPQVRHVKEKEVKGGCAIMVVGAIIGVFIGTAVTMDSGDAATMALSTFVIGPLVGALLPIGILQLSAKLMRNGSKHMHQQFQAQIMNMNAPCESTRDNWRCMSVPRRSPKLHDRR